MSLGMGSDVEIVEAAYRLTPNPQDWLRGVLERCGPRLFDGLGGFATMYRRDAPTPAEMSARIAANTTHYPWIVLDDEGVVGG